jgi:hypothetical protein
MGIADGCGDIGFKVAENFIEAQRRRMHVFLPQG